MPNLGHGKRSKASDFGTERGKPNGKSSHPMGASCVSIGRIPQAAEPEPVAWAACSDKAQNLEAWHRNINLKQCPKSTKIHPSLQVHQNHENPPKFTKITVFPFPPFLQVALYGHRLSSEAKRRLEGGWNRNTGNTRGKK
jgi:hypothetical protein